MIERVISLAIYWGVWLILPMLVDGLATLVQFVQVMLYRFRRGRRVILDPDIWPGVSVVVPVYNGAHSLGACLDSLQKQHYPPGLLEIIVVDNGSNDNTYDIFQHYASRPFAGQMHWMSIAGRGKSYALNAGIHMTSHRYICTVDADAVVHPDALREMARHFEADRSLVAATGTVEVLPAEKSGVPAGRIPYLIAECEFHEYLAAFWLGRQGQALSNSLYTLAGVFSFFRRDALLNTPLYDKQTVSEDTKITFDIRERFGGQHMACIPESVVYVTSTPSLSALYAQRVRWQRGELEVAAVYQHLVDGNILRLRDLSLGRILLIDHTFLFPRLVWTFIFPALCFFGYPLSLVTGALLLIYAFYIGIAAVSEAAVYLMAPASIRRRLRPDWWMVVVLPAYRMLIYFFRLAGSIIALTESPAWRVQNPVDETIQAVKDSWSPIQKGRVEVRKKEVTDGI